MQTARIDTDTRDELVQACASFSDAVIKLRNESESKGPIVIFINGHDRAGKSLIWDELVANLLGDNLVKVSAGHKRAVDRWEGFSEKIGADLRVHACNLKGIPGQNDLVQLIEFFNAAATHPEGPEAMQQQLGDIILINNTDYANDTAKLPNMIYIPDFKVSLLQRGEITATRTPLDWKRSLEVSSASPVVF